MSRKRKYTRRLPGLAALISATSLWVLFSPPLTPSRAGAENPEALEAFREMANAVDQIQDCEMDWVHMSRTVGECPIKGTRTSTGKFVRSPARYWKKIIKMESDYDDPTKDGSQMISDPETGELLILLPGVTRLLGVVHVFREDPKSLWLNREALRNESIWRLVEDWEKKLDGGRLSLRRESCNQKEYKVLTLEFDRDSFEERPEIEKIDIWVDPDTSLPLRHQGYIRGWDQPVLDFQITRIEPNPGLGPEDIKFEGLSLWDFPAQFVIRAEGLDRLEYDPPPVVPGVAAPGFDDLMSGYREKLSEIRDYRAEMFLSQRYFRLRSSGGFTARVIRDPFFFHFQFGGDFRTNHLTASSAGCQICFYREMHSYANLGGGAMRIVGVQLMHVNDRRTDLGFGEGFYNVNLFSLLKRMEWYRQKGEVGVEMVRFDGRLCPRVVMRRKGEPMHAVLQDMLVVFDPDTHLPLRVDYTGLVDPEGFGVIEYRSIETNLGLEEEDLRF